MRTSLLLAILISGTLAFASIDRALLSQPVDITALPASYAQTNLLAGKDTASAANGVNLANFEFPETTERPLFSRDRRKFVPPPPPKPVKPRKTAKVVKPKPKVTKQVRKTPAPKLTLIGISISDGRSSALFSSDKGENRWVLSGDSINSWIVGDIDANSVQLTSKGRELRLQLYEIGEP